MFLLKDLEMFPSGQAPGPYCISFLHIFVSCTGIGPTLRVLGSHVDSPVLKNQEFSADT